MKKKTKVKAVDIDTLPYRPCVGIMLVNDRGLAFVARRNDTKKGEPEAWQMPQGGIDKGEDALAAAMREMEEEIGTDKAEILAVTSEPLRYDLPSVLRGKAWKGKWRGQEQTWVLMRFTGVDSDINLETEHPEFDAWEWVAPERLPEMIVAFKRPVYEAVVAEFRERIREVAAGAPREIETVTPA